MFWFSVLKMIFKVQNFGRQRMTQILSETDAPDGKFFPSLSLSVSRSLSTALTLALALSLAIFYLSPYLSTALFLSHSIWLCLSFYIFQSFSLFPFSNIAILLSFPLSLSSLSINMIVSFFFTISNLFYLCHSKYCSFALIVSLTQSLRSCFIWLSLSFLNI